MKFIILILSVFSVLSSFANSFEMLRFNSYQKVGNHPLVVVHASTEFNPETEGKKGLDQIIKKFKDQDREVYFLYSNKKEVLDRWYTENTEPTALLYSYGGENNLISESSEFTLAGGFLGSSEYFEGCLTTAISYLVKNHFDNYAGPLKLNIKVGAVYTPKDRSGKTLTEHFESEDVRGLLAWLITDSKKALKGYPRKEHSLKNLPFDLAKVMAKNYQCNYRKDEDCHYLIYDGFWNVFKKDLDWALAGPSIPNYDFTGLENNVSFEIYKKDKLIAYLGKSHHKVKLNFID